MMARIRPTFSTWSGLLKDRKVRPPVRILPVGRTDHIQIEENGDGRIDGGNDHQGQMPLIQGGGKQKELAGKTGRGRDAGQGKGAHRQGKGQERRPLYRDRTGRSG